MSSFLVLSEGDTRNRWRDGQVCPDVGQETMAPWARRLGCVLACYAQIERGRSSETFVKLPIRRNEGRVVNTPLVFKRVLFSGEKRKKERRERDGKRRERRRKEKREETTKEKKRSRGEREEPALYGEKG
ncbi:hypothetical protein TNCV_1914821 [Trichonephila clavipes]|nr:hypothetical protein TNCV_1914821 [Trichonephila clavipes]